MNVSPVNRPHMPLRFFFSPIRNAVQAALSAVVLFSQPAASAAPDGGGNDSEPAVAAEAPLARWQFDGKDSLGTWDGTGHSEDAGPRPPAYPGFVPDNHAASITSSGTALVVKDSGADGAPNLRFGAGESITLETWVRLRSIRDGQQVYLIGKGRNGTKEFGEMNQNYALRLKGGSGQVSIGFLFSSLPAEGKPRGWHRWWSGEGFVLDSAWHHVAVTYTFGKGDSLRGYIDGRAVDGKWDMDGATDLPPVSDGDSLLIGSGYKRASEQTLDGWLDDVAIYREALPAATLQSRYARKPSPPVVERSALRPGVVQMQICEAGVPGPDQWPAEPPGATETYDETAFGFSQVPQKYVSTGVRADRASPFLLRAAALVDLPKGKHRLLLRGRGAARLYVDGKELLKTTFPPRDSSGHGHVSAQDKYLDLGSDFRFAPPGNREAWAYFESDGTQHLVVLETIVGGNFGSDSSQGLRPELGETVVAWSPEGSESWQLLSPSTRTIAYTDGGWAIYEADRTAHFDEVNAGARAAKRSEHAAYWAQRRKAAADWLASTPEIPVPALPAGYPGLNEIDSFLGDRLAGVIAANASAGKGVDYFKEVQPIFESKCYGCHQGGKVRGGLHLDNRADALRGGKNDGPALKPGQPDDSPILVRVESADADEVMPPKDRGDALSHHEIDTLRQWIAQGASWPEFRPPRTEFTPLIDDLTFLRRVTLDTVGVVPSESEIREFLADPSSDRRAHVIDRLLADPRCADHWMGYWLDVLAENPNILNPTLNNTGPFRWWLYESLQDNKPMDLFVTELLRMEGSQRFGGPAGFGVASQNDVPMAAKAIIVGAAFQGVEMKCARCHDSPANVSKQEDLFALAAMLNSKPITLPASSSVPQDRIHQGGRKPLIEITLKPGSTVAPKWPFQSFCQENAAVSLAEHPDDPRDRVAALITNPQNTRFAEVIVNCVWQRLMGRGIVEPVGDWEKGRPSHPELLRWLAREFVRSGYDVKAIERLVFSSHSYQRASAPDQHETDPLYVAPARRRLTAEQIVDSCFSATGKPFRLEEVSLDIDGMRNAKDSISLGQPRRAWMLTSTSNERDRPSLTLPRIQAVTDVLEIFGWRGARPDALSVRDTAPNVLQPAILSNGTVSGWLTRLSDDHGITSLALEGQPVESLVDRLFLRVLTRRPTKVERDRYVAFLAKGYDSRAMKPMEVPPAAAAPRVREHYVSWSNHLDAEATVLRHEQELQTRRGDAPTSRLNADWRERIEDVLWALLNSPDFVFTR